MSAVVSERERQTCFICRRRRAPDKMTGTRCTDEDGCLRATGRWVSASRLTGAELAASAAKREGNGEEDAAVALVQEALDERGAEHP